MPVQCICPECSRVFFVPPARSKLKRLGQICCSVPCKWSHLANLLKEPVEDRFWRYVIKTDSCWLWTDCKCSTGYGSMGIDGKQVATHRLSWQVHIGPIPVGMRVLHNCPGGDNPACVNPAHLFLGTQRDNVQDCIKKGRRAEQNGKHKGWCYARS